MNGVRLPLSRSFRQRISRLGVRRPTHVGNDRIKWLPFDLLQGLFRRGRKDEGDAHSLQRLPFMFVVAWTVIHPEHCRPSGPSDDSRGNDFCDECRCTRLLTYVLGSRARGGMCNGGSTQGCGGFGLLSLGDASKPPPLSESSLRLLMKSPSMPETNQEERARWPATPARREASSGHPVALPHRQQSWPPPFAKTPNDDRTICIKKRHASTHPLTL